MQRQSRLGQLPHKLKFFFHYWKRYLTATELLDETDNIENIGNKSDRIILTPADNFSYNTYCDSGGEESNDHDRLNHDQLAAEAEFY